MQSHQVTWNVSLSNGGVHREGVGIFKEFAGKASPWQLLLAYLKETGQTITSLWLSTPDGTRHHLPSMVPTANPKLKAFHEAKTPIRLRCTHRVASDMSVSGGPIAGTGEWFTIAEATYETHVVQVFVSELDTKYSWVLVTING